MRFHQLEESLLSQRVALHLGADFKYAGAGAALSMLRGSQKFFAGDLSMVEAPTMARLPRMPFPYTAWEFELAGDGRSYSTIVLASERDRGLSLQVFVKVAGSQDWRICGLVQVAQAAEVVFRTAPVSDQFQKILVIAAGWVLIAQEVLACRNVFTEVIEPASRRNRERVTSGRGPIYSYKVLVMRPRLPTKRGAGGGQIERPVHLVRGHIKHRKTGVFWWQPHARGNPRIGVVMKDYDASRLSQRPH